jgi:predicted dehydrogenase
MALNAPLNRKLRMGLVGGGQGSFIGRVHSIGATMDHRAALVAGALSADPAKARASAADYGISPERAYGSYQEMVQGEKKIPEGERIDFVSIATPNNTHFDIAQTFAEAGFNVMCDKPLTFDLAQSEELAKIVQKTGVVFGVTHNYTGYPMVRQAREMVRAGELGDINAIRAFYIQGWLRSRQERGGNLEKQAAWRTDPKRSGAAGGFGDIGTHAYNLGRFITGLLPDRVSCLLKTYVPARELDDYGTCAIWYANGALGTVTTSQISHGRENDLWIEIDGTKASLEWHQEEPNKLMFRVNGQPHRLYTRDPNAPYMTDTARGSCRLPSGHPEAFLEAFANVYTAAYTDMIARASGQKVDSSKSLYPNIADGVDGMNFITQCVASSRQDGHWLPLKHPLCRS